MIGLEVFLTLEVIPHNLHLLFKPTFLDQKCFQLDLVP